MVKFLNGIASLQNDLYNFFPDFLYFFQLLSKNSLKNKVIMTNIYIATSLLTYKTRDQTEFKTKNRIDAKSMHSSIAEMVYIFK